MPISGLYGKGLERLFEAVQIIHSIWQRRISTAKLNRWLEIMLEAHPPPLVQGRRLRIRYMTQIKSRPPTFALFVSRPSDLPESYLRYLIGGLRDEFMLNRSSCEDDIKERKKSLRIENTFELAN